jgi:hypothetical protein
MTNEHFIQAECQAWANPALDHFSDLAIRVVYETMTLELAHNECLFELATMTADRFEEILREAA